MDVTILGNSGCARLLGGSGCKMNETRVNAHWKNKFGVVVLQEYHLRASFFSHSAQRNKSGEDPRGLRNRVPGISLQILYGYGLPDINLP